MHLGARVEYYRVQYIRQRYLVYNEAQRTASQPTEGRENQNEQQQFS